ncbi:MAG: hypothetical protein QF464_00050 [Myxococcota bacterium]|jgi:hypothetical protein|nr:hypothetical protein [Myxococcota bacterium]
MLNRPFQRTLLTLAIVVVGLGVLTSDRPMAGGEIDALAGGGALVDALFEEKRPPEERLQAGFLVDRDHPRARDFARQRPWRRHLADPPLARWAAGLAILVAPSSVSDRTAAHWMACLLLALAALVASWLGGPRDLLIGGATLASAAALDAAGGASAAAVAALSMAGLLWALQRLVQRRRGALVVGVIWGMLLAYHPGALFLVVPIFATVAIAWQGSSGSRPGALSLPAIPPALLVTPVIAVLVLIAIWPTLWTETGRGLAIWMTDAWWAVSPDQTVGGQFYHQAGSRAPQAFTATLQWLVWTPWPVLLAWVAGLVVTVRQGRAGLWSPVLVLVTVLLVGGADGGLFGARRSLLAWLWVPTAVTASLGFRLLDRRAAIATVTACLAWALLVDPWGASAVGAEARGAAPIGQLQAIGDAQPRARVHVASRVPGQRHAIETLRWRDALDVHWADPDDAEWSVILGEAPGEGWWSGSEPEWTGQVAGVPARRYRRR